MTPHARAGVARTVDWAHKLVSLVLLPVLIYIAQGAWTDFKEIGIRLTKIEAAFSYQIPHLYEADRNLDSRITRVEGWVYGRRER